MDASSLCLNPHFCSFNVDKVCNDVICCSEAKGVKARKLTVFYCEKDPICVIKS